MSVDELQVAWYKEGCKDLLTHVNTMKEKGCKKSENV